MHANNVNHVGAYWSKYVAVRSSHRPISNHNRSPHLSYLDLEQVYYQGVCSSDETIPSHLREERERYRGYIVPTGHRMRTPAAVHVDPQGGISHAFCNNIIGTPPLPASGGKTVKLTHSLATRLLTRVTPIFQFNFQSHFEVSTYKSRYHWYHQIPIRL